MPLKFGELLLKENMVTPAITRIFALLGLEKHAAARRWRMAAEHGDAEAQSALAYAYHNGEGVTKDPEEAVRWCLKAAEQGHAIAQSNVGYAYFVGEGVTKDPEEAVRWSRKAAEQGNAFAQFNLGRAYHNGEGVTKDPEEAMRWYLRAGEQGHAGAEFNVGGAYHSGEGVTKDPEEAVRWYRKAAEQGHAGAQFILGGAYYNGEGVAKDPAEAVRWWRKAAEQGDAFAQRALGHTYYNGEGVARDPAEAVRWWRKAAEQGHADAQFALAGAYGNGEGVAKDPAKALRWCRKAAEQGHPDAQRVLASASAEPPGVVAADTPAVPTPWCLVAIVAVNVLVFALELAWGGSDSPPTLHRMGAGLGRVGLVHEPWRIVSSAFLHLGVFHLLMNMWALLVFGRLLEVVLGARRLIVLYALCAAAGGLASSVVHAQILSAGASGAVWGLMTAQIALIVLLRRQEGVDRVPVKMSSLMQPLAVNLLISLMPGIDMAAHLGGGAAGAGLILSGLIGRTRPEPARWRPAAWAASLAMAGCLAMALGHGRPWEIRWPPALVPHAIPGSPVVVPVPGGLQPTPSGEENAQVFGNLGSDPLAVYCSVGRLDAPVVGQSRPDALSQMARAEAARPLEKNQSWDQVPHIVQLHQRPAVFSETHFREAARIQTWLMVEGSWWLRLDVVVRPDAPASWAKLPTAIAEGITILPSELRREGQGGTGAPPATRSTGPIGEPIVHIVFPARGEIRPLSFPNLLAGMYRHRATGSLTVTGPRYAKALYFREGHILFASSNDPHDQLGTIFIESGKISREQLDESTAKMGPGNPLAKVLEESGFLTKRELGEGAREKVERILTDVLSWEAGSFEFEDGVLPKGAVDLRLSTERLLLAATRRLPDQSHALRHVGLSTVLEPVSEAGAALAEVRVEVWPLLGRLDGHRTLQEAIRLAGLEEVGATKTACAMLFLGIVRRSDAVAGTTPPPVLKAPAAPSPAPTGRDLPCSAVLAACGRAGSACVSLRYSDAGTCQDGVCVQATAAPLRTRAVTTVSYRALPGSLGPPGCVGTRRDLGGTTREAECLVQLLGSKYTLDPTGCNVDGFPHMVIAR